MKIGGVKIINLDSLRGKFDLEEVWRNLENGVLLDCQRDFAAQRADLAQQIVEVLEGLEKEEEMEKLVSAFYQDRKWDLDGLERVLKPLSTKSRDHSGNDFYSRNIGVIRNLAEHGKIVWDKKKAALFYLFLILMLQVRPRQEILSEEAFFIQKELGALAKTEKETKQKGSCARMYPYSSGVFYLSEGKIVNEQGKLFSPEQERIDFFTYTDRLGIIAFTKQGEISDCTEANVRYEIRSRLERLKKEDRRVIMAAACGNIYLLLTANGQVIGNIRDSIEGWKKIRWIGVGLNSITAIREKNGNLLELGSDSKITEFSGVKAAYTWSDGKCRYGILKENGIFIMDDGGQVDGVCAANIDREGYLYTNGTELFFRRFEIWEERKCRIGMEGRIAEVCKYHENIYYWVEGDAGEQIGRVAISEFG